MIKKVLGLKFLLFISYCSFSQNVGIGTATPGASDVVRLDEPASDLLLDRSVNNSDIDFHQANWIINKSSNKRLPSIIRDLDRVLDKSDVIDGIILKETRFRVILFDGNSKSFTKSAIVQKLKDSIYRLELNRHNRKATDNAIAVTLIHEFIHCVLLDLDRRARKGEKNAVAAILNFGLPKNDSVNFFNNDFFVLMNKGEDGQHELMHKLLYDHMVYLLKEFERMHTSSITDEYRAEHLIWSGLQKTSAFEKMPDEEKILITEAILKAKGIQS